MVSMGKCVINSIEMPHTFCLSCDRLMCYWAVFHKLGLPFGSSEPENGSESQGSGMEKCFMAFFLSSFGGNVTALIVGNRNSSKHSSYPGQGCVLWELQCLHLLLYLDGNPQLFETLFPHFQQLH